MPEKQQPKKPLVTAKPRTSWKDMTDDDIDALADRIFATMTTKLADQTDERSSHDPDAQNDHGAAPGSDFDAKAATWDDEAKVARARLVADAIVSATAPGPRTTVFEYGAGTGLVTEALGDRIGPAVLADTSAGMREVMAAKVADGRLGAGTRIVDLDLDDAAAEMPTDRFDLVVTVLTMHHVADLDLVLRRFRELTAADGHLCIVDLDAEDGSFHGDGFGGHHGFDRDELAAQLHTAGFAEVEFSDCGEIRRDDGDYPMFLAVARSPAPAAS